MVERHPPLPLRTEDDAFEIAAVVKDPNDGRYNIRIGDPDQGWMFIGYEDSRRLGGWIKKARTWCKSYDRRNKHA